MQWQACPPVPLAWFQLRELLLTLLFTPALLLPLVGALALLLAWWCEVPRRFTMDARILLRTVFNLRSSKAY